MAESPPPPKCLHIQELYYQPIHLNSGCARQNIAPDSNRKGRKKGFVAQNTGSKKQNSVSHIRVNALISCFLKYLNPFRHLQVTQGEAQIEWHCRQSP